MVEGVQEGRITGDNCVEYAGESVPAVLCEVQHPMNAGKPQAVTLGKVAILVITHPNGTPMMVFEIQHPDGTGLIAAMGEEQWIEFAVLAYDAGMRAGEVVRANEAATKQ